MSRRKRILTTVLAALAGLLVILVVTAILVVQSGWFRGFVRDKIVSVTEESTGGKVEIGSFDFDWTHLRATIRNFVLHGTEPSGQAPLFQASLLQLDLRLFTGFRKVIDLAALRVDQPRANVLVYPDGRTNVPEPKVKSQSNKSGLETIVDLEVGRFDLTNGSLAFNAQKEEFNARGENLHAQLFYNTVKAGYQGQVAMSPLHLTSGKNAPVNLNVTLPLVLEKDRILLQDAKVTSPESQITINASIDQLNAPTPHIAGRLNARLALSEAQRLAGTPIPLETGKGLPEAITAELSVDMNQNTITISTARVNLGDSNLEAAGTLKDPSGRGSVQFNTTLAVGQLGRLFKVDAHPDGTVRAQGNAKLTGQSGYAVTANMQGNNLAFQQGQQRFRNISIAGALSADPKRIAVEGLKLAAFGGQVTGQADLEDMQTYHLDAVLHGFDLRTLARTFASQDLPYNGVISGPVKAAGNLKVPGTKSLTASVRLAVTPQGAGTPVSGKINADYSGASDVVRVAESYVALPNTRLDISGSLDREIRVKLVSRNLNDFQPALNMGSKGKPQTIPLQVRGGGSIEFNGTVTGKLAAPRIGGRLEATNFTLEDRPFDRFSAELSAAANGARVEHGSLSHGATQLQFQASAGLRQWKPDNDEPVSVNATVKDADMADLLAIAGQKDTPVSGVLNAAAQISGTIGNPHGDANLTVLNGNAYDEHFDRLAANVSFADRLVRLSNTQLIAGTARIDLNATFEHPQNSFDTGTLQAHVASNQMALDQFNAVRKENKGLRGTAQLNADVTAKLDQVNHQSELLVTSVNANASAQALQLQGRKLGDVTAAAQTAGSAVNFKVDSDFAGSTIRVNGQTRFERDYPTTASASINNLPIEQVLAVADRADIPAQGNLSATAQLSGTLDDPHATVELDLTKAVLYQEPLDRVKGQIAYSSQAVSLTNLEITEGPSRIVVTGNFEHPKGNLEEGRIQFRAASNEIQLGGLHLVQQQKPGLHGTLQVSADAAGTLRKLPKGSTELPVLFTALNASAGAHGLEVDHKPVGNLTLKADTRGGEVVFSLDSDVGRSTIHGEGQAQLQGNYPVKAQLSFANLTYAGLLPLLGSTAAGTGPSFDALAEGRITVSGPVLKPDDLTGEFSVSKLQVSALQPGAAAKQAKPVQLLQNEGPLVVALNHQALSIQSGHVTGPSTDINLSGSVALNDKTPLNLQVKANSDLKVLTQFDRSIYSSGQVAMQVAVRGTFSNPLLNGQLQLDKASVNLIDMPVGISNATGTVRFNGNSAVIQDLKAQSGGGTVTLGGFVGFAGGDLRYGLRAGADHVRVRTPEGISVVASAAVNLNGTTEHSILGGEVTVNRVAFNPRSDFGSLLSRSSPPVDTPEQPSGPLAGMKLDIRIRTATDVAVQTSYAQNLQADADLTLRGTPTNPGMLGRVNVTSGKLVFFGTTYDVNNGSVAFFNPLKIDPILDVNLETKAQGVDVILSVSGPVNNMKLSYRSDPPLQFNEVVELLATGKTPTSDPTILVNQPAPPQQSMQQMGASAIVSQAVASPLSSRLERVFGVTQLKIDPTFVSGSSLPQARLTLQQQIASNITFTYIEDLSQSNSEIVRVEWAVSQQWSVVATRDEYGMFGVDFFYKKQFR